MIFLQGKDLLSKNVRIKNNNALDNYGEGYEHLNKKRKSDDSPK